MSLSKIDMKIAKVFARPRILATFAIELFDSKTLKIAQFLSRYHHLSNNSLKIYFSNDYIKSLKI